MEKRVFAPELIISGQSIAASFEKIIDVLPLEAIGLDFEWSGSNSAGTIAIQATVGAVSYDTLEQCDGTQVTVTISGASGYELVKLNDVRALNKIKINYTASSGTTGTLNVYKTAVGVI